MHSCPCTLTCDVPETLGVEWSVTTGLFCRWWGWGHHTYDTCEPGEPYRNDSGKLMTGLRPTQSSHTTWVSEERLPPTSWRPLPSPLNFVRKQSPWICYLGLSWNKHSHYPNFLMQSSKEVLIRMENDPVELLSTQGSRVNNNPHAGACPVLALLFFFETPKQSLPPLEVAELSCPFQVRMLYSRTAGAPA